MIKKNKIPTQMNNNIITSNGYGVVIFSPEILENFLIENKINEKKLTALFDRDEWFANQIKKTGIFLPIITESFNDYYFDFFEKQSEFFNSNDWSLVKEISPFNLKVTNSNLWICSINILANWNINNFRNNQESLKYEVGDGNKKGKSYVYEGQSKIWKNGIYKVSVFGYKRKQEDIREKNYGIGFKLETSDEPFLIKDISDENILEIEE